MIMFVSRDAQQASDVLDVWTEAGIAGVTIFESAGMDHVAQGIRDDVGLFFSLQSLLRDQEVHHRTLMSAVPDEVMERVVAATTAFVGDWSKPDVGVLLVWPLSHAFGLEKHFTNEHRKRHR
jgi:hypothetical protein